MYSLFRVNYTGILCLYEIAEGVYYFFFDEITTAFSDGLISWEELLECPISNYIAAARKIALEEEGISVYKLEHLHPVLEKRKIIQNIIAKMNRGG